jgi:hypothetical protein
VGTQIIVPAGKRIGLKLITVSSRPVVQHVLSTHLKAQGLLPCDVIVTIDGKHVGDATAVECAQLLAAARARHEKDDAILRRGVRAGLGLKPGAMKLGVLRMAPVDSMSSYNSQHPIDVAAALTNYDPATKMGVLCFSVPHYIPADQYKVEVYRFGAQVVPMFSRESDHSIRYTRSFGVDLQQSNGRFGAEREIDRAEAQRKPSGGGAPAPRSAQPQQRAGQPQQRGAQGAPTRRRAPPPGGRR